MLKDGGEVWARVGDIIVHGSSMEVIEATIDKVSQSTYIPNQGNIIPCDRPDIYDNLEWDALPAFNKETYLFTDMDAPHSMFIMYLWWWAEKDYSRKTEDDYRALVNKVEDLGLEPWELVGQWKEQLGIADIAVEQPANHFPFPPAPNAAIPVRNVNMAGLRNDFLIVDDPLADLVDFNDGVPDDEGL